MGSYQTARWLSDSWEAPSGVYHPYCPDVLAGAPIMLAPEAAAAVARAEADVARLNRDVRYVADTEPLARLILRSEAIASSRIEGLEVPAGRLLEHEALDWLGVSRRLDSTEASVLANIHAMREGVDEIVEGGELTLEAICRLNKGLLANTWLEDRGGVVRSTQNWVGGNDYSPVGSAFVPPPPELVGPCLEDLIRFCNESPFPACAVAALAHAQFETIHPFADGNGRTGRALIHALLRLRGVAPAVMPPVSLVLATDRARYIERLTRYRVDSQAPGASTFEQVANEFMEYFAAAMSLSCARAERFEKVLAAVERDWRETVRPRAGSAADLLLHELVGNPVVSVESAASLIGRSGQAARLAINRLVEAGVLRQNAKNRKSNIYVARDVVDAFTAYERALSVPSGDTSIEKPLRPVPQRLPR